MHTTSKSRRKTSLTNSIEMGEITQQSGSQQGVAIKEIPLDDEVDKLHEVNNKIELPDGLQSGYLRTQF